MGLFRLAAIVAVGVSLLPADREKQQQLYARAAMAATWTVTFCDRNGNACTLATSAWSEFSKKAEFGAKLAYDMMRDNQITPPDNPEAVAPASVQVSPPAAPGTLTERDLKPAWRGKTASKAGI